MGKYTRANKTRYNAAVIKPGDHIYPTPTNPPHKPDMGCPCGPFVESASENTTVKAFALHRQGTSRNRRDGLNWLDPKDKHTPK